MGCKNCDTPVIQVVETELSKTINAARIEATNDNKTYVVILHNGKYFSECLECRNKAKSHVGEIVAYVR